MAEPPPEISAELLAIASEALSNIARHARASAVRIDLARQPGGYRLSVVDNGVGLNLVGGRQPGHHGFANMRDRALGLGGRLEVSATHGGGTTITVRVPDALTSETIGP
jgi:signal transduction histidine kinase